MSELVISAQGFSRSLGTVKALDELCPENLETLFLAISNSARKGETA